MILGLDISPSIIGLCIMDGKKIIHTSYFDLHQDDSLSDNEVFDSIKKWFSNINSSYKIHKICIEEPMKRDSGGKTSISVLSRIFKVNFTLCRFCYEIFNMEITYVNASTARKKFGISKKDGLKRDFKYYSSTKEVKKFVLERTLELYPEFEKQLTFSKTGIINAHILDITDAIVMSYYGS